MFVTMGLFTAPLSKNAAAIYEYNADCDGDWGEIQFDFVSSTAEIVALADGDYIKSKPYANKAIRHILSLQTEDYPKKLLLPVTLNL